MKERWKDIFIGITLLLMGILAMIALTDIFLTKTLKLDFTATVGFIGAIVGGALSGTITLAGVKMTIDNDKKEKFVEKYPLMLKEYSKIHGWALNVHLVSKGLLSNDEISLEKLEVRNKGLKALLDEYNTTIGDVALIYGPKLFNIVHEIFDSLNSVTLTNDFIISVSKLEMQEVVEYPQIYADEIMNIEKKLNEIEKAKIEIREKINNYNF
ncbi:hypothetical protein [Lysinibacillus sp. G01H]|uniref:hypothetical protein n=1 Tax=Lysinibacillus sp. G01H TaxID=3026425 RepID=UPI00237DF8F3|nr:hypothetical protein [Lysinibacillus sp. G01H]WDU77534.1 hypothetical protein PSR12_12595 [Lysinibacillus sp. G01H]